MIRYNGNYGGNYGAYNGNYGEYGARARDGRGRFMGEYGRRGVAGSGRGRYRGHDLIDDMDQYYGNYNESRESYRRGNYGAADDSMKSLDYMLKSVHQFLRMLKEDADNPEEQQLIQEYVMKMGEI